MEQRYRSRLPAVLGELAGPTHGIMQLPLHVAWSGQTAFDLDRPKPRMHINRIVLAEAGDDTGFRHYWELCVILGLRSGDIFVPGSRRAAKYLSDPAYRRKIARQLNKGERLHALRRDLHYAQQGAIGKPLLTDQTEQARCLTVLTNAVITWTTEYYQLAVQDLRAKGRAVPGELLAHISPAHSENVNFFGVITVDVEGELAKLDTGGWRPLRPIAPDPGPLRARRSPGEARVAFREVGDDRGGCSEPVKRGLQRNRFVR